MNVLVRELKSNTGNTALCFNELFLKISYIPKNSAEITAKRTHIISVIKSKGLFYRKMHADSFSNSLFANSGAKCNDNFILQRILPVFQYRE
jgi:hypothetical protein